MYKALSGLNFSIFEFNIIFLDDCILPPYKGSTLRGAFGHAFKRTTCIKPLDNQICYDCQAKHKCIYCYSFETPPPEDTKRMKLYSSVPHPFIIEPPLENKINYYKGDILKFNLILIGKAIDNLFTFITAFEEMGRTGIGTGRGKFLISHVINYNFLFNKGLNVYHNGSPGNILTGDLNIVTPDVLSTIIQHLNDVQGVTFNFSTPTRIKYNNKLIDYLEFHIFMRNLIRRLSSLYYFHCNKELAIDFRDLIKRSMTVDLLKTDLQWEDWERFSTREFSKMKLGGFQGEVTFKGDIKDFIIFILFGKFLHIGKGVSMGLGKYDVMFF